MPDLQEYSDFAIALIKECGQIARKYHSLDVAFEPKGDNSPVTVADLEINRLVIERCKAAYPSIGILGEEESEAGTDKRLLWVCDPIDGTTPYVLGMSASTNSFALVEDGVPVVGVVYDFMNDRLYSAIKGQGALLNGQPIKKPDYAPMKLVSYEWWHEAAIEMSGFHEAMFAKKYQVPNFTSAAFTSMQLALGRVGGVVYAGKAAWDIAAPKIIVEEAGGIVRNLRGEDQRYDQQIMGAIVAWPQYYEDILSSIESAHQTALASLA